MQRFNAAAAAAAAAYLVAVALTCMPPTTSAARVVAGSNATTSLSRAPSSRFPALFAFGDSIFDTGNNDVLVTAGRCDYSPYGKDFQQQRPTGRCSNGRLASDMIASTMGIKDLLPPYLTTTSSDELLTGVCFASIGTGYDPATATLTSAISMSQQFDLFRQYKVKIAVIAGEDRANSIVSNSLYILNAGGNDVVTYFLTPLRQTHYNVSSYAALLVNYALDAVQEAYNMGARKIGVSGIPPIGCVPRARNIAGDSNGGCASSYNALCVQYNTLLSQELNQIEKYLHGSKIIYIDLYKIVLDFVQRPSAYGFKEVAKGCCSTAPNGMDIFCNSWTVCQDDSEYLFWDSIHPTEKAYGLIIKEFGKKYLPIF